MASSVGTEPVAHGLTRTRGADVDIAFRVQGSGPAVVLLHGTSANHAVWDSVAEILAADATVITLDQRGHGRSDKPARGYTGRDFAGDVITVLDAIDVESAVIGGHSLGARNAWMVAALFPERAQGVLAVDYTPYVESTVLDELAVRVAGGHRGFSSIPAIEDYLRSRYPRIRPDAVARRAQWGYELRADGLWWPLADPSAMQQLIEGFRSNGREEFREVRCAMSSIRGQDSRIVSPAAWDAAIADRVQDGWIVADGADHYIPEELPELVADELGRLLAH